MYKVMIIDDEPIIVEGMTQSIPWEKWDCEVVGTAGDGEEGRDLIKTHKPHIIFSDIAMPGVDGLAMISGLKSEFEDMEVSILTGYRDFDYAQQAIRLGVTRFLLKPSSMEELEESISAMVANLKKKNIMSDTEMEEDTTTGPASSFVVKHALQYMERHYAERLTLYDVAEHTYVSQWHLSKLLNKHTGQSYSEILNAIRIKHAQKLLRDSSLRIGDVAERVGFLDMAHFSRVFKKVVGMSAQEYRNREL